MFKKRENIYDIEEGNLLSPKFDNDGLIPVITMCSKTKDILMHGYMNVEALKKTIETKEAHYFSRSRNTLWHKGKTSGFIQKVKENFKEMLLKLKNVKFIKGSMSGKSDKIEIDKFLGLTTFSRKKLTKRQIQILTENEINKLNPIIWDGNSQISGDEIILKEDLEKNVIDSLKISNNSFIVEIDTISKGKNYNQMKGIKLFGKIIDNKLNKVKIDKNAELVYYMYDENQELIGIDKALASSILISFKENGIDDIIFFNQPEGVLYPEDQLEENQKTLFGFINRFEERITKEEKF